LLSTASLRQASASAQKAAQKAVNSLGKNLPEMVGFFVSRKGAKAQFFLEC
jgi:hypothetical protein